MTKLGVIGAGTMGSGIAQVAAQQGIAVTLVDASRELADAGRQRIQDALARGVERGRLSPTEAEAAYARVLAAESFAQIRDADCVIEAVVEDLAVKREVFHQLEEHCSATAILASNTSSLSITEIAGSTRRPERVVGMHFFNPVPAMALVEVIQGAATAEGTVAGAVELARRLGKTPVRVADGPGFLVNRVARPFYTEALRIYSEGIASVDTIDRVMRGLGFPMGPFQLMDLIGNDVNLAVTTSIYEQMYGEPRFRPSPAQRRLVSSGWLGRKTGRGWYDYSAEQSSEAGTGPRDSEAWPLGPVEVAVDGPIGEALFDRLQRAGIAARIWHRSAGAPSELSASSEGGLGALIDATTGTAEHKRAVIADLQLGSDAPILSLTLTAGTTEIASWAADPRRVCGFGILPPLDEASIVEVAPGLQTSDAAVAAGKALSSALGKKPVVVSDGCGLIGGRMVAVLINEAAWALTEGVATAADIDISIRLGVNYPRGLLEWGDTIGVDVLYRMITGLQRDHGDERYRAAPLLRKLALAGWQGDAADHGFFAYH